MRIPRKPPAMMPVFKSRTEDLVNATQQTEFVEFTHRSEASYWPWDVVRMTAPAAGVDAEIAWALIKMGRNARSRRLPLVGAGGQQLHFNVPDRVQRDLMLVDQQTAGLFLSDDEAPFSPHQREAFIIRALHEEAIASSMLEGAATTIRDARKLLWSGRKPRTVGERMVVNNYHAILFIREHRKMPLSREFLLELQATLTKDTLGQANAVGRFRRDGDHVRVVDERDNQVVHVPPPASELDERIERLCRFANQGAVGEEFIHPVIKACVLHFQIGFDHPLCDGNGRTARALFYWSMLRNKYWLFEYLPISRFIYRSPAKYVRAYLYSKTDEFDITYFLAYKAKIIGRARQELREYLSKKQAQLAEARKLFRDDARLNQRQREVVLQGARDPDRVFTMAEHQQRFAVSYATARSDLLALAEWGYLTVSTDQKRYDFYPSEKLRKVESTRSVTGPLG